jgi:hypothetical protein
MPTMHGGSSCRQMAAPFKVNGLDMSLLGAWLVAKDSESDMGAAG